jgi:hypothetical protein
MPIRGCNLGFWPESVQNFLYILLQGCAKTFASIQSQNPRSRSQSGILKRTLILPATATLLFRRKHDIQLAESDIGIDG